MKPGMAMSRTLLGYAVALKQRGDLWVTADGVGPVSKRLLYPERHLADGEACKMRKRYPSSRIVVVRRVIYRDALELFREALRNPSAMLPEMAFPAYMEHGPRAENAAGYVVRAAVELAEAELTGKDITKALRGVVRVSKTYIRALQAERERPARRAPPGD